MHLFLFFGAAEICENMSRSPWKLPSNSFHAAIHKSDSYVFSPLTNKNVSIGRALNADRVQYLLLDLKQRYILDHSGILCSAARCLIIFAQNEVRVLQSVSGIHASNLEAPPLCMDKESSIDDQESFYKALPEVSVDDVA